MENTTRMNAIEQYLMENPDEATRLDIKTDPAAVMQQARMFGIGPGARVLDGGCGSGKTSTVIHDLVQPGGEIIGVDFAEDRIQFARRNYGNRQGLDYRLMDLRSPLEDLGKFDFIWVRFVLEYYREGSFEIIRNLTGALKPEGQLCLLDLDYNCMSHYPLNEQMESILMKLVERMTLKYNFDPHVGRKLYTYMYDLGFRDLKMHLLPHHLIYGGLATSDDFNWIKKVQMASVKAADLFIGYPGGYDGFFADFNTFFHDPRRFTYTPLIMCQGKKPL
jgi:2-polyprenyl-3-methyl-5-hydroxy-6-metoxy-1,4-benzoquinol methylase